MSIKNDTRAAGAAGAANQRTPPSKPVIFRDSAFLGDAKTGTPATPDKEYPGFGTRLLKGIKCFGREITQSFKQTPCYMWFSTSTKK